MADITAVDGQVVAVTEYAVLLCIGDDGIGALRGRPQDSHENLIRYAKIRRLMSLEAERLQGFPDNYTAIRHRGKPASDGSRYKALGNSMAVPVLRWIGQRIAFVHGLEMET